MNPFRNFRRFLPEPETLQTNRWLRWLGPRLLQRHLWHFGRRGVAVGLALGVFFGLLVPIAQIPLSAGAAVLLRGNLPAAAAATLVTNPVTVPPVYYAAWKLGGAVLGTPQVAPPPMPQAVVPAVDGGWRGWVDKLSGVGKPLIVGLALMACSLGLLVYFAVSWGWALRIRWARQRRVRALLVAGPHAAHKG